MTHWIKFARAHEHLDEINHIVERFTDMKPHRFITEYEPKAFKKGDTVQFTIRLYAPVPPPIELAVLAADCLGNLRSSLDHLVFAIAQKHAGSAVEQNRSLQFAIYDDPQQFSAWQGKVTDHLPSDVLAFIEGKQPYNIVRGYKPADVFMQRTPLWTLNALVNADKHRTLAAVTSVRVSLSNVRVIDGRTDFPFATFSTTGTRMHGAEITSFPFVADSPDAKVTMDDASVSDVAFSDEWPARGRMVRETIRSIRDEIREVIFPALEPRL